jgi:hypothetical protein
VAVTVAALFGTSAFAEDRHRNGTRGGEARASRQQDGGSGRVNRAPSSEARAQAQESRAGSGTWRDRNVQQRDAQPQREAQRNERREDSRDRSTASRNDSYNRGSRNDSGNRNDSYNRGSRNDSYNRGGSNDRNRSYGRNDSYRNGGYRGTPSYYHGRVSRYDRYNGGYRVWIVGAPYPFFIPEARFRLFPRFGIGIDIRLGGYYNSLGYYDYYDGPAGVYSSSGYLRGTVESVDYRRGTFVLRNEETGSFVTAVMSGGDRRWDNLRSGDYVEISGDWTRTGVFQAYRIDEIGDEYRR